MPSYDTFYLWKRTGTYADVLAAVGLMELLWGLNRGKEEPELYEDTAGFRVVFAQELDLDLLEYDRLQRNPMFQFISTKPGEDPPNEDVVRYDYMTNKANADAQRDKRKLGAAGVEVNDLPQVDALFYIYQQINMLQGVGARNKLIEEVCAAPLNKLEVSVKMKLQACGEGTPPSEAATPFSPKVAALQVFNPTAGKGINRPKLDSAARGPLPASFVDWFEEWLRFIGVDQILSGYRIGDDIKLVVPVPKRMNRSVLKLFRQKTPSLAWTSRKADILAVFDTLEWLLEKNDAAGEWGYGVRPGTSPSETVSSIQSAYFKSLGSAKPVMNISSIGLPNWFPVESERDVKLWKQMIDEHRLVLRFLDERKSEEEMLLQQYRDFLASSDWRVFLRFLGSYGCLLLSKREKRKPIRSFSYQNLEELLSSMSKDISLRTILENEGFRSVANAIRLATVSEQYAKSQGKQKFDIKYSLFQELKRRSKFPNQLMSTLFEFINEFNAESARRAEQLKGAPGRRRKRISEAEVVQFAELFDHHKDPRDTETIAMLLIALASSKGNKAQGEPDENDYEEEELD